MFWATLYFVLPLLELLLSAEVSGGNRVDCMEAKEQCRKERSCRTNYQMLRQCLARKQTDLNLDLEATEECHNAIEALKQTSLYNCYCKRGTGEERSCLRIYWRMYPSLQGSDLLEGSPYEPVNSTLSDIFGMVLSMSAKYISKENNCLNAANACNLNNTCRKYKTAFVTPCITSIANDVCNRHQCHKALRQFFDQVPAKLSYGMLFCSCHNMACVERRRQTFVPACSHEERKKPNCLAVQESCQRNYICRARLTEFFDKCHPLPQTASGCFKKDHADCLRAYSGLIGTVMTPNYIDSSSLSVAPGCDCNNSGDDLQECYELLNFFKNNMCLKNAIQAFGNGSDAAISTAFWVKKTPGPARSENEVPKHVFPPCKNLQQNYGKDGLAGACSNMTTKSMAAPPSCRLRSLLVLVATSLSTLYLLFYFLFCEGGSHSSSG